MSGNLLAALTDNIVVDKNACIFCGKCAETCVLDNIRLRRAPCSAACPLGLNVQGYVQLTARGREDEARALVQQTLPFAGIICRICDHPCETACSRRAVDGQAVNINGIKRALFADKKPLAPVCAPASGKSVGIVGSGPAGLMSAHDLRRAGHAVTVYEREARPGGLLRSLLPVWKLPERHVDEAVAALEAAGVTFCCDSPVDGPDALAALKRRHDAVILAPGAGAGRAAGIEGEDLPGVHAAFPFLASVRAGHGPELSGRVLVLGGGSTALDCAEAALRQGADEVVVVYRRQRPAMRVTREDFERAREAGVRFAFTWTPLRLRREAGRLVLDCGHDMGLLAEDCADYPDFRPDEQRRMTADAVIVAVGQEARGSLAESVGWEQPDALTLQSGAGPVFVAGDAVLGPSSAIRAMASGRRAAESVARFLAGKDLAYGRRGQGAVLDAPTPDTANAHPGPRREGEGHTCAGKGDVAETTRRLTREEARAEARRCLNCGGPEGYYRNCWFCLPCEVECPKQALRVEIPYLLR